MVCIENNAATKHTAQTIKLAPERQVKPIEQKSKQATRQRTDEKEKKKKKAKKSTPKERYIDRKKEEKNSILMNASVCIG